MRIELRLEKDEHEYAVTVECDRIISPESAIRVADEAMARLLVTPNQYPPRPGSLIPDIR
jgi:hypothetical protein